MALDFNPVCDISLVASEDLSAHQYNFVTLVGGEVALLNATTDLAIGVLQNAPVAGEAATIRTLGISKVVANDAIAALTPIMAEYVSATDNGKAQASTTNYHRCCGYVLQASTAEDTECSCFLNIGIGNVITA